MTAARAAQSQGAAIAAQVAGRPVGLILGLTTSLNPFTTRPSFAALAALPPADRLARLRDPATRAAILAEAPEEALLQILPPLHRVIATQWEKMFLLGNPPQIGRAHV
jgi:N-acyl-D-aspartate/D-glutamate deacylase